MYFFWWVMNNDITSEPIARTTCELKRSDRGPTHRGAVESVDASAVVGWCLEAASPLNATTIEIHCNGLLLITTQSSFPRADIADMLGAPCRSGFRLHWIELSQERRDQLIERLCSAPADSPIDLRVRVTDAPIEVDRSLAERTGLPTAGTLLKTLRTLAARPSKSPIAAREQLLDSIPKPARASASPRVRAVAFYLPQFHPIPENDEWWGKGFTEWTNVAPARPLFEGHDQPRIPSELGYYDLRTPGVIEAQIELARAHGLSGFCFHHYWFGGQRLLDRPLERFLQIDHDFGFCICWANEPWSRRWDGSENEVLMPQPHSLESDIAFINDAIPILKDRRYIRVDGKPILVIYRVGLFKDPKLVFGRWRQICEDNGLPGLHICMAETFGAHNPWHYGCDSAVEFPPHNASSTHLNQEPDALSDLHPKFNGKVYDYRQVVANQLLAPEPEYPIHPTVMLAWDNTSRRELNAHIFHHFSPASFETWLEHACQRVESRSGMNERLVFINAWNEWGEGTYLEPDRRYGRGHLESVRRIVTGVNGADAAFHVLKSRLRDDTAATKALERINTRIQALEASLRFTLGCEPQRAPYLVRTALSMRVPEGTSPRHSGGRGHIDHIRVHQGTGRVLVRRGEIVHCEGWAVPADRVLTYQTPSYVKISMINRAETPWFGAILHRAQRSDVVQHFINLRKTRPTADQPEPSAFAKALLMVRGGVAADSTPKIELHEEHMLWSGFSTAFSTEMLESGRYGLSIVFPIYMADCPGATEVPLDAILEISE